MSKLTATPIPWRWKNSRYLVDAEEEPILACDPNWTPPIEVREELVRAVNAHAALLAAAQSAKDELERLMAILGDEDYATAEAVVETLSEAIKLAEGES